MKLSTAHTTILWLAMAACCCAGSLAQAASDGRVELDEATQLKISAKTVGDLEKVVQLCESAIEKGLSDGDTAFAKQLLTSTLYQHAQRLADPVVQRQPPASSWPLLRRYALNNLEKALKYDDKLGDVYLLIAQLQSIDGGEPKKAKDAAEKAVELLTDDTEQLSEALVVRGSLSEDQDKMLADLDRALELNPRNSKAWRVRGVLRLRNGEDKKALDDFMQLAKHDPNNTGALQAVAEVLVRMKKYDQALEHLDKAIKVNPDLSLGYVLRARVHLAKENAAAALVDLNNAIRVQPRDLAALLMRAQVRQVKARSSRRWRT